MKTPFETLKETLGSALDDLASPRSVSEVKTRALETLEQLLAGSCVSKDSSEDLHNFTALQYTFECNVPLRLLAWISTSTLTLEVLTNKGTMNHEQETQASKLSSQLCVSLSLIQGVALNHNASKGFLGRKYALEVLLDLLLASRHLPSMPPVKPSGTTNSTPSHVQGNTRSPLSSIVLDTMLCILVDSPPALRAFEEANGIQAVVKILKRAGTPREVRMKCLEFLYFYLLDETSSSSNLSQLSTTPVPTPTAPSTPLHASKRSLSNKSLYPSSRYPSTSSLASGSSTSSRSTSGSSMNSLSSTSSNASSWTTLSSSSSPDKLSMIPPPKTPPNSPPALGRPLQLQPRSLMMLRKEVDYTPLSPKKPQATRLGVSGSSSRYISKSRLASESEDDCQQWSQVLHDSTSEGLNVKEHAKPHPHKDSIRTTEEKKELLGTMLGNVDALVEGVRKAGIWGLG